MKVSKEKLWKNKKVWSVYVWNFFYHAAITSKNVVYCKYERLFPSRHYLKVVTTGKPGQCLRVSKREVATPSGWLGYSRKNLERELVIRGSRFWDLDFFSSLTLRSLYAFLLLLREMIRASVYERTQKICPFLFLITSSLSINHLHYRASRMGANFLSLLSKSSEASIKTYERSEFRVAFAFIKF